MIRNRWPVARSIRSRRGFTRRSETSWLMRIPEKTASHHAVISEHRTFVLCHFRRPLENMEGLPPWP